MKKTSNHALVGDATMLDELRIRNTIRMADLTFAALTGRPVQRPADLIEASAGFKCYACGRDEFECSLNPCLAVIADREGRN